MTLTDASERVRVCPVCDTQTTEQRCPRDGQLTVRPEELVGRAIVDPLVGQTLEGKFEVQARVGAGSMGTVYRATQLRTGATVALKVLHPALAEHSTAVRRFLVEAQNAGRLESAHCVRVLDRGETPFGLPFLAMEFVSGETLAERVNRFGPMTAAQVTPLAEQVVKGLGEAHQRGLVHRDIKPENIMLVAQFGDEDLAKILDFGIARTNDLAVPGTQVLGTPRYMAPEQWEGRADARADLYALGCLLHFLLTGRPPFEFSDADEHVVVQRYQAAHRSQLPPPLPLTARSPLAELIDDLLRKDPEQRPRDAGVVLTRLRAMRGHADTAPAPIDDPGVVMPTVMLPLSIDEDAPTRALPLAPPMASHGPLSQTDVDEDAPTRAEQVSPGAQQRTALDLEVPALPRLRAPTAGSDRAPPEPKRAGIKATPTTVTTAPETPPQRPWLMWLVGLGLALLGGIALGLAFGG